jgi:hypothetical protein
MMYPILAPAVSEEHFIDLDTGFQIVVQCQPFANVIERHVVAVLMLGIAAAGIDEVDVQFVSHAAACEYGSYRSPRNGSMP